MDDISKTQSSETSDEEFSLQPKYMGDEYWMVPCKIDSGTNEFVPQCRPQANEGFFDKFQMRQVWTTEEDRILASIIERIGSKAWTRVSTELNNILHGGKQVRQGKQCRERWFNHLNPDLKKGQWTLDEDIFILEQHRAVGNRWSEIARCMQGRNENSVKNRLKSILKRAEKEMPNVENLSEVLLAQKQNQRQQMQPIVMFPQLMQMASSYAPIVNSVREGLFSSTMKESAPKYSEPNYTEMFEQTPSPSIFIRR